MLKYKFLNTMVYIFFAACIVSMYDCSDNSVEPEETVDIISGLYFLSGKKVETRYSEWPSFSREKPSIDTTFIGFIVNIDLLQDRKDTIRLYGLQGADVGDFEDRVYPDCTVSDDCKIYGRMTGIEEFEINLENNERTYQGSGTIRTLDIELTGQYHYQNITIDYDLEGEKMIMK